MNIFWTLVGVFLHMWKRGAKSILCFGLLLFFVLVCAAALFGPAARAPLHCAHAHIFIALSVVPTTPRLHTHLVSASRCAERNRSQAYTIEATHLVLCSFTPIKLEYPQNRRISTKLLCVSSPFPDRAKTCSRLPTTHSLRYVHI